MEFVLPTYEADVRRLVRVPLTQNQFDALVSFDYARGVGRLVAIAAQINAGHPAAAEERLRHFDDSSGQSGLQRRREAEADVFGRPGQERPR